MVKIDGIPLRTNAESTGREVLADEERTAGGFLRQDVIGVKRSWKVSTPPITKAERDAILNYLDGHLWKFIELWHPDFGPESNTVICKAELNSERRLLEVKTHYVLEFTFTEQ
jgi:hypothetical protein